jgi:hypothetical protein
MEVGWMAVRRIKGLENGQDLALTLSMILQILYGRKASSSRIKVIG